MEQGNILWVTDAFENTTQSMDLLLGKNKNNNKEIHFSSQRTMYPGT